MDALCLFPDSLYCFYQRGKKNGKRKVIKMLICFLTAAPENKKTAFESHLNCNVSVRGPIDSISP